MQKNVGTIDPVIRVILGIILIGLGIYFQSSWGVVAMTVLIILGMAVLITGIIGFCILYKLFKISTIK
jgi:predicted transporter